MNNRRHYRPQHPFSTNSLTPQNPFRNRPSGNKDDLLGSRKSYNFDSNSPKTDVQSNHKGGVKPSPHYRRPYSTDPNMVNRVAKYLEKFGRSHHIDFDKMLVELQQVYPDLRRRKRAALMYHLRNAVGILDYERSLNEVEGEIVDDEDDVIEEDDGSDSPRGRKSPDYAFEGDGDMNSTLENSYLQNAKRRLQSGGGGGGTQELINIVSSDEGEPEPEVVATQPAQQAKTPVEVPVAKAEPVTLEGKVRKRRPNAKTDARTAHLEAGAKKFKALLEPVRPSVSFKDIGGSEKVLQDVTQLLIHMRHPEVYATLGVCPPRGFLLHGPPGSGKTLLANAIAGELSVPLLKVAAPELVGGLSGQSEQQIRELFAQAEALAPSVLFIDEIDAITPHRETAHREMERRIVAQLLSSMDELGGSESGQRVLVVGATNRPDSLDPALRRAGRFDREVCLGIPDRQARQGILRTLSATLRLDPGLDLAHVAAMTPGFVGADLKSLVTEAAIAAVNRLFNTLHEDKSSGTQAVKESKQVDVASAMEVDGDPTPGKEEEEEINVIDSATPAEEKRTTVDSAAAEEESNVEVVTVEEDGGEENKEQRESVMVNGEQEGVKEAEAVAGEEEVQVLQVKVKPPSLLHSPPFTPEQLKGVYISVADFEVALKSVQPSAKREGFATVPDVRWQDIGSLQDIRHELTMAILAPVRHPAQFAAMGLSATATGVLLCGPPGCGKTLLAKAVANEAGINFISVKGPELLNMYVGESERAVRQCFQRARSSQPCVIFFDEIDALCPKRSGIENGATRVVNQLLTEMDGVESRTGVFLMAATNRPDIVDPAVMRPGRLDKVLYVGLPAADDRLDILRALTKGGRRPELSADVDLSAVANDPRCEGYTGADLAALVREASLEVLRELVGRGGEAEVTPVCARHFHTAMARIRPSVSDKDKKRYELLRLQYAAVPPTPTG